MIRLALASLWNRRVTALLTILTIALSIALLLSVEKLKRDARASFSSTVSGTDLIVGARSGSIQLLLYSVFRIGNATNNISWDSYQELSADPAIDWTIPLSLGDSHRGYRVLGTTTDYFERFRYARDRELKIAQGVIFDDTLDAVLGAEVADALGYAVGQQIVLAHGAGDVSLIEHDDKPFTVTSVLERTGTPVDRTVHVSLEGIEAIHEDWEDGAPRKGGSLSLTDFGEKDLTPSAITAFMVGLKSRAQIFQVQRYVNEFENEPMLAIVPGVALQELWGMMGIGEAALRLVAMMVVATGIIGMLVVILSTLEARRREMSILRSVGARTAHIFTLFISEAGILSLCGVLLGLILHYLLVLIARPISQSALGINLTLAPPAATDWLLLAAVVLAGLVVGIVPAVRACRLSLNDGLTIRV